MVPKAGLEPARVAPPDFESGTSTNSITRANKTHLFVPKPPASVGSRYWEFQQLTRLSSSVSGPVSGLPGNLYAFLFSVCLKLVSCIKIDLGISVLESGNPNPSTNNYLSHFTNIMSNLIFLSGDKWSRSVWGSHPQLLSASPFS